jgi:hypothetical protein
MALVPVREQEQLSFFPLFPPPRVVAVVSLLLVRVPMQAQGLALALARMVRHRQ